MNTVRELLQDKIHEVAFVEPDKSAHDAMQLMADKKIGALLVQEDGKMIGIISERDYPGKAKALDKPLQDVLVKEVMSSQVVHVSPEDTIETLYGASYQESCAPFASAEKRSSNRHHIHW